MTFKLHKILRLNLESNLQMRIKIILVGGWFVLINKLLQPKIIYICPDR